MRGADQQPSRVVQIDHGWQVTTSAVGVEFLESTRTRWIYSLAEDVDKAALERLARNVSTPNKDEAE